MAQCIELGDTDGLVQLRIQGDLRGGEQRTAIEVLDAVAQDDLDRDIDSKQAHCRVRYSLVDIDELVQLGRKGDILHDEEYSFLVEQSDYYHD